MRFWYHYDCFILFGQLIDGYIRGDKFFEASIYLFQNLMRDYRKSFYQVKEKRRDQGFFLYGQVMNFLHRLLQRSLRRINLPSEVD